MKRILENPTQTYSNILGTITTILSKHYESPYNHALSLISSVLETDKQTILLNLNNYPTPRQVKILKDLESRVTSAYPISYILGNIEFYKEKYKVNESVLIPRPETEMIVNYGINFIDKFTKKRNFKMLEIGTGTGCISISILKNIQKKDVHIIATDISEDALSIARANVKLNLQKPLHKKIEFMVQDILSVFPSENFDLIVSNPPYIPLDEYYKLDKSLFYEPQVALTDNEDGLKFYKRLAKLVKNNLNTDGMAMFELHSNNIEKTLDVFKRTLGNKANLIVQKDTFERDRFLMITT